MNNGMDSQWTLCSERMPPLNTPVWLTIKTYSYEGDLTDFLEVVVCRVFDYGDGYCVDAYNSEGYPSYNKEQLVAWMPYYIPKPYGEK